MTRPFTDAPQAARCAAVVTLKDKTTADCGRRATYYGFCWQHAHKADENWQGTTASERAAALRPKEG